MKQCRTCRESKEITEFYKQAYKKAYFSDCKPCYSKKCSDRRRIRKLHPKTENFYHCEICNVKMTNKRLIHTDHNHLTGEFRGFLCVNCNQGLGKFKDDTGLLRSAIKYLCNNINETTNMETENNRGKYLDCGIESEIWKNYFC